MSHNPIEQFLDEYGSAEAQKTADFRGQLGHALTQAGHTALATGIIAGAGVAAEKIYSAATKARDFRNMMSYNPDLQEHHDRDPRMFNQMFSSLRSLNPAFSKDPLVSGTYMRKMLDYPATAGGVLTEAIGSRDKFPSFTSRALDAGAAAAGKSMASYKPGDPHAEMAARVHGMELQHKEHELKGQLARMGRQGELKF